jgi:hypothetical protein
MASAPFPAPPPAAGYQQYPPGYMMPPSGFMPPPQPRTSGMAIAGFVLSFFSCLSILGLIFSLIGLSQVRKGQGQVKGGGLAIAGIVISCCWLVLYIVYFILIGTGEIDLDSNGDDWD